MNQRTRHTLAALAGLPVESYHGSFSWDTASIDPSSGYMRDSDSAAQACQPPDLASLDATLFGLRPYEEPVQAPRPEMQVQIDMSLFDDDSVTMWAGETQDVSESMGQQ